MILSDIDILSAIVSDRLVIEPFDHVDLQPASVDLHLANDFKVFSAVGSLHTIDPQERLSSSLYRIVTVAEGGKIALHPGDFLIASTVERFELPADIGARIEGKSSLARLGISIHSTGGFIDPGFKGDITLEISSVMPHPVLLRPGMKIAQIGFYMLSSPAAKPYGSEGLGSKYQGQSGATISRYHLNDQAAFKREYQGDWIQEPVVD